jgi:hypothetical protein
VQREYSRASGSRVGDQSEEGVDLLIAVGVATGSWLHDGRRNSRARTSPMLILTMI